MTEIGTVVDGKYEILKEIGRGGMSIVYLAMDKRLNKQWAVKEIRKKGNGRNDEIIVNSLLAEANLMKRLDHPTLPRIVDIIDNGRTIYVVMDYIEGESLDKILAEYGAQPEELVIGWVKQICDALGYLHAQKPPIVYRDMKPANVMLKPEGNIKIIDFGIAREYKEQNLADTTVLGTKGYAPPEQYSGQTDPRSDIFALGMTMHHLLTGIDPRGGEPYAPVRQWNPELSEGIEIIIDKCVEPAAENRYQNCADLLYDLEHPELITKGYKKKQKRKMRTFIASAVLSVVTLIGGFAFDMAATNVNNNNYDVLIGATSGSLEQRIDSYRSAIDIYPYEPAAYMKMLEAYEQEGLFTNAENSVFVAEYEANKLGFDPTSVEVAELKYKLGTMYFSMFKTSEDAAKNTRDSIKRAAPYFKELATDPNIPDGFTHKTTAECYHYICDYYMKYLMESEYGEEATPEGYREMVQHLGDLIDKVEQDDENTYTKLALYDTVFVLLYDQRAALHAYNVNLSDVLAIYDQIYREASSAVVTKGGSVSYQREILDHYEAFREAIELEYYEPETVEVTE